MSQRNVDPERKAENEYALCHSPNTTTVHIGWYDDEATKWLAERADGSRMPLPGLTWKDVVPFHTLCGLVFRPTCPPGRHDYDKHPEYWYPRGNCERVQKRLERSRS